MTESISKQSAPIFHQPEQLEIDLKGVLNLIKQSYKLILVVTTICFLGGIYYIHTRQPIYRSSAMIEVANGGISSALVGKSALPGFGSLQNASTNLERTLLKSPYILSDVVQKLGMDISVSPQRKNFFSIYFAKSKNIQDSATVETLNLPPVLLAKSLTLLAQRNNQYALLTQDGKKILEGVVGNLVLGSYLFNPLQIKVTKLNASPGMKFNVLKRSLADVSNNLSSNLTIREDGEGTGVLELSYFSSNPAQAQKLLNTILAVSVEKNSKQKAEEAAKVLRYIAIQLPTLKHKLQENEFKLSQYSFKTGVFSSTDQGQILINSISNLQKVLQDLKFKKMILLQKFTAIHPLIIAMDQKELQVKNQIKEIREELKKLPKIGQKEISLKRNVSIDENIYSSFLKNQQQMEMLRAGTLSGVRILSTATYPISPVPVKKRSIIFGSIILGLMISLAVIFLRHILSPVIEDPEIVEQALEKPVLAIIPCSQKQIMHNKKIKRDKNHLNTHSFLLSRENSKDLSIEGLRSLRTAIQMLSLDAKDNVLSITGCSPSVGKSFISSNLAMLISDLGKRVLVIDADMRLGKLHQALGKMKIPGLATFLENEADLGQIIQSVVPGRLDFISTGHYPSNPSELLSKTIFGDLISTLRSRYDLIVLDIPPILAVTDPALVLRHSSMNIMVLGIGKDQMKEVKHAKHMLEKSGVELTGVVFNTLSQKNAGSFYGYGKYNYHYAYEK